jgi:cytochrome c oxidase assembly protein subunit 11
MSNTTQSKRNRTVGLAVVGIVFSMVTLAYASVPLYRIFCQVTGYGGTPQITESGPTQAMSQRKIKVRFNADVNSSLDWKFKPYEHEMEVHLGETALATYLAENDGKETITGTAIFNVTPLKAAPYFNKVECFCFSEQTLAAGETADMPVSFFVDPEILEDPNTQEVRTITLSYTFYRAKSDS